MTLLSLFLADLECRFPRLIIVPFGSLKLYRSGRIVLSMEGLQQKLCCNSLQKTQAFVTLKFAFLYFAQGLAKCSYCSRSRFSACVNCDGFPDLCHLAVPECGRWQFIHGGLQSCLGKSCHTWDGSFKGPKLRLWKYFIIHWTTNTVACNE